MVHRPLITIRLPNIPDALLNDYRDCAEETSPGTFILLAGSDCHRRLIGKRAALMAQSDQKPERAMALRAIPRSEWPMYAIGLAALAIPADRGIGDVIARKLGVGGEIFKAAFLRLTGRDCGCNDRQLKLNAMYPLREDQSPVDLP